MSSLGFNLRFSQIVGITIFPRKLKQARTNTVFMVIDTTFHGLVEKNPKVAVRKFTRYILPKIIEEIFKGH